MVQKIFCLCYGSILWCNVGITSARAKALHVLSNDNKNI